MDWAGSPVEDARALLISRALCRFRFMPRLEDTTAREALGAARLHAEGHAPFAHAAHALYRTPKGFAIWWWDAERVAALVPSPVGDVTPESAAFAVVDGWRQLRTAEGYEAQYAEDGVLRASLWRRRPFTDAQWKAFADTVESAVAPAPDAAPAPVSPERRRDLAWRTARVSRDGPWRQAERALWAVTALALVIGAGFGAHTWRYRDMALREQAAIDALGAHPTPDMARTAADLELIAAASRVARPPEHMIALADVVGAMRAVGGEPVSLRSDGATLRAVSLDAGLQTETLALTLEKNPRLRDVAPVRRAGGVEIVARIEDVGAALADGAAP